MSEQITCDKLATDCLASIEKEFDAAGLVLDAKDWDKLYFLLAEVATRSKL